METATICRQATARSLIVLDEVGRGTSMEDGCALAQAVLEHLHDHVQARTMFATHFRELALAVDHLTGVAPHTFAVLELSGQLAFTHRITPGVADRSYGLHVARLAGLPEEIVTRAQELLDAGKVAHAGGAPAAPDESYTPGPLPLELVSESVGGYAAVPNAPAPGAGAGVTAAAPTSPNAGAVETPALPAQQSPLPIPRLLSELLRDLERLDLARTTPLQALLKLADVQQAARRLLDR